MNFPWQKHPVIRGALILTLAGLITRILGFFYRIYLSNLIGAENMGLYQLTGPVSGICFALCCGPIQTAVSRFCAAASAQRKQRQTAKYLFTGLLLSECAAFLCMTALYSSAPVLAKRLLGDSRCTLLLRILALSLPLSAAHAAISGYCYGKKQAAPPAVCQLLEQLVRIATLVLIANRITASGVQPGAWAASLSLLAGETASLTFSAFCLSILLRKDALNFSNTLFLGNTSDTCSGEQTDFSSSGSSLFSRIRAILRMSFPLAANRLLLGLLQSLEAVQIPARLILFGSSSEEALSIYGVLTGMALPFLFFPFALTNSVSVLLLPSVAEAQSLGDDARIRRTIELALSYSLYIGILCTGIFAVYGKAMGQLFFPDTAAGSYLSVLGWLCPFLYPASMAASILNGTGRTGVTFRQNLIALGCRICFVIFLIPHMGIRAYLYGMLASELLLVLLHVRSLCRNFPFAFSAWYRIIRPMAAIAAAVMGSGMLPVFGNNFCSLVLRCSYSCIVYLLFLVLTREMQS